MRHVFAAALSQSKKPLYCHPESAESLASDSQRRACPEPAEGSLYFLRVPSSRVLCEKWDGAR